MQLDVCNVYTNWNNEAQKLWIFYGGIISITSLMSKTVGVELHATKSFH